MLIYNNTFDNIKTIGCKFPIEDQYFANDYEAIVADGITRDPIGISDFSMVSVKDFLNNYPRPSGAELAAKRICDSFKNSSGTLKERLIIANKDVKELNNNYIKKCDYLEHDYYGAVASCVRIKGDTLYYAYICDCGIIVYDKDGNIKFKTEDDKELYSDPFIDKRGINWNLPESRIIVRSEFRNNMNNIVDNRCVSYGALTGEDDAIYFIKEGNVHLDSGDIVLVYSDGLSNFLKDKDFINQIINFNKEVFELFINNKSKEDYSKYGSEKTIVIFKY